MSKFFRTQKQLNPAVHTKLLSQRRRERDKIPLKLVSWAAGIFLLLVAIIYLLVYSPAFRINKIRVAGADKAEILQKTQLAARRALEGYAGFIWPRDNVLFLHTDKLYDQLAQVLVFDDLAVKKDLPNNLDIAITEKIPVLLWQEGRDYFYVDRSGVVMKSLPFDQVEYDLPIVSFATTTSVTVGLNVISPDNIRFMQAALEGLADKFRDWRVVKVAVSPQGDEFYFYASEGWYLILPVADNIAARLEILTAVLNQKITDRTKLHYIDLRILDRVFYK